MRLQHPKISILYTVSILIFWLQSCTVYQSRVSLDEAARSGLRAKIERNGKSNLYVKKIEYRDSVYYGIKPNGEPAVVLDKKEIKSIREQDKSKSALATFGMIVGIGLVIGICITVASITVF